MYFLLLFFYYISLSFCKNDSNLTQNATKDEFEINIKSMESSSNAQSDFAANKVSLKIYLDQSE